MSKEKKNQTATANGKALSRRQFLRLAGTSAVAFGSMSRPQSFFTGRFLDFWRINTVPKDKNPTKAGNKLTDWSMSSLTFALRPMFLAA